jgi:hypothetical protein
VTTELTEPIEVVPRDLPPPRRGRLAFIVGIVAIAFMVIGLAYLWLNNGDQIRSAGLGTPPSMTIAPVVAASEDTLSRGDFDKFRQQNADFLRTTTEALDAQKAGLKVLSDQVTALSAKFDALQGTTASLRAPGPVAPIAMAASPPHQTVVAQHKKPSTPKSAGPISVGGAPLPAPAE